MRTSSLARPPPPSGSCTCPGSPEHGVHAPQCPALKKERGLGRREPLGPPTVTWKYESAQIKAAFRPRPRRERETALIVDSPQSGRAQGINPQTTRTSNHETAKSAARGPAERTHGKLKPQRLTVINTSQWKLPEGVPPWRRVSDTGVCVPLKGSPLLGRPGVPMVRRSEEWTREQEAGTADLQGQGA